MKQVCVLGNGQPPNAAPCGRTAGIAVPLAGPIEPTAVPVRGAAATAEIERWPETALTCELARHPAFAHPMYFRSSPTARHKTAFR